MHHGSKLDPLVYLNDVIYLEIQFRGKEFQVKQNGFNEDKLFRLFDFRTMGVVAGLQTQAIATSPDDARLNDLAALSLGRGCVFSPIFILKQI